MNAVAHLGEHAMMTAILHDVIEDTRMSLSDLAEAGCPPDVLDEIKIHRIPLREACDERVEPVAAF